MKIVIAGGGTGGHLFPAVALGEELRRQCPAVKVLFIGASTGMEASWLPQSGLEYELFEVHGLRGHTPSQRLRATLEFAGAVFKACSILRRRQVDLVVSVGGYASAPAAVAAIVTRRPLVLLEQNTTPGLANRMLWRFAKKICVGFNETAAYFDPRSVVVTGNPVRCSFKKPAHGTEDTAVQILVLGGSSGAHRLNLGVVRALEISRKTVIKLPIVHQTGEADVGFVEEAYARLGLRARVVPFIDDVAEDLNRARLVVARSGAMTVSEIALSARPAVFVPYPFHRDRQQELNAQVLEKIGAAIIVKDDDDLGRNLADRISSLIADPARLAEMGRRAKSAAFPHAAATVAEICFDVAGKTEARV